MAPKWSARMVGPDDEFAGPPLLRREFVLDTGHGPVAEAVLHATARGVFTASVNGSAVSDEVLSPGWSSYEWRLRYRSYDVTPLLPGNGAVVLGLALGNGWHRGRLGWLGRRSIYGDELGALAQLEVVFADGHRQIVVTDESWRLDPDGALEVDVTVPDGVTAEIDVPGAVASSVGGGRHGVTGTGTEPTRS